MWFSVLGPMRVSVGDDHVEISGIRQRTLLAVLLIQDSRPISTEELVDALWPEDPPRSARENVRAYVYHLRRALDDPNRIQRSASGYSMTARPDEYDASRFEAWAAEGRAALSGGDTGAGLMLLDRALGLWRGTAFADLHDCPPLRAEAARLDELRLAAVELRLETLLAAGRHAELVPDLASLVREHPLREGFRALLMLALYRSGRQTEALKVYRDARRSMVEDLGLEPGSRLREIEAAILRGDRTLLLPAARGTGAPGGANPVAEVEPEPTATTCMLPADIADFTGRDHEAAVLCRHLTAQAATTVPIAVISGPGGVGKTTLGLRVAHRLQSEFPDGQLYVNLYGAHSDPTPPAEALTRFLRALGVDASLIPESLDERAEMYRARLAGRRVLVVLDNAADEAQVEWLLPADPGCGVLLTSRVRLTALPGAHLLELGALNGHQAVALLGRIAGPDRVAAEPQAVRDVARLCGHLPLALRIAGARLAARPHWSFGRLASRLTGERDRLNELVHGHLDVRASLTLSFQGLDERSRRLLAVLGLLNAPDFTAWVGAAILDSTVQAAEDVMDGLVDAQLLDLAGVDPVGQVRYRFHDLVRLYAREQAEAHDDRAEIDASVARALTGWLTLTELAHTRQAGGNYMIVHSPAPRWACDPVFADQLVARPVAWCETERLAIVAAVRQAAERGLDDLCWDLAVSSAPLFEVGVHHDDWAETHECALGATRRAGNRRGEAAVLAELGELRISQHRHDEAAELLCAAEHIFAELTDRHGRAIAVHKLGILDRLQGRFDVALRRFDEVAPVFREVGDLGSEVLALRNAGQVCLEAGDPHRARTYLEQSLSVAERAGERLYAQVLFRLGELYLESGDVPAAERALSQVLELVRGFADLPGQAWALLGLGRAHLAQDRFTEAENLLTDALAISRDIHERMVEARTHLALGQLHRRTHRLDLAATHLRTAEEICLDLAIPFWAARAQTLLAEVLDEQGDHQKARAVRARIEELDDGIGADPFALTHGT